MRNVFPALLGLAAAALAFTSCQDSDRIPAPAVISVPLILPTLTADSDTLFNYQRTQASDNILRTLSNPTRPVVKFTINLPDQRDVKIKAVQVYKSFRTGSLSALGPRALAGEYTTFPATVALNSSEVLTDLLRYTPPTPPATAGLVRPIKATTPAQANSVFPGSQILFTFEYVLEDGRHIILTPLNTISASLVGSTDAPATYDVVTGTQVNAPYAITMRIQ